MEENKEKEEKPMPTYEFKKIEDGRVEFITYANDESKMKTIQQTTKEKAFDHYKEMIEAREMLLRDLAQLRKKIEENKVEKTEEIERLIALLNDANRYREYSKLLKTQEVQMKSLYTADETIKRMETAFPELLRKKK